MMIKKIFKIFSLAIFIFLPILIYSNQDTLINYTIQYMDNFNYSQLQNYSQFRFNKDLYDLPINDFKLVILSNYKYSNIQNCRFWSYLYYNYFKKKGFDVDYITSLKAKHMFIIAFNSKGGSYYFLDQNIFKKYSLTIIK